MSTISVSLPSDGTSADVADYNTPLTTITNAINGNLDSSNILSLNGTKIVAGTLPSTAFDTTIAGGWMSLPTAPDTITYNGNRSYTMVYNNVNYSTILSPGYRQRTTRTVAAPTQCTSLNGTTQYYSKSSPAGMTFTDDFVVSAWVKLTSYAYGGIVSRYNNGTGNGWQMNILASGGVQIVGFNGSGANSTAVATYQALPLNKWVHIAAQLDMSSSVVTGGANNYIMLDGVDVPIFRSQGGTNPTALVPGGNLEVGHDGITGFFPGKIAQAAVFSAKVTQATMRGYMSQGLAGTETSLISAYSFNNSITDLNTTSANNLSVGGGSAVATNADSPFGNSGASSTLDYAMVQTVTFSTNTTVVLQVPEGCTIPTSGGVSAVSYSSTGVPYGFPKQKGKWRVQYVSLTRATQSSASAATFYNLGSMQLSVPIGEWMVGYSLNPIVIATSGNNGVVFGISTSISAWSDKRLTDLVNGNAVSQTGGNAHREIEYSASSATPFYALGIIDTSGGSMSMNLLNDFGTGVIYCDNAYL